MVYLPSYIWLVLMVNNVVNVGKHTIHGCENGYMKLMENRVVNHNLPTNIPLGQR